MNPVRNIKHSRRKMISNGVKITIKNFQKKISLSPKRIKKTILNLLSKEAAKKSGETTVCFVTDKKIKELNLKFLRKNSPTDVLAFDMLKGKHSERISADIVISTDTAIRNSRIFKTTYFYELSLYLVHGLLHILGYNHSNRKASRLMRRKEREYVNT